MYRLSFDSQITTSRRTSDNASEEPSSYWRFSASLEDHPDEIVGRAVIFLHKKPPTLYTITVDNRYRGLRIGTKLLDYVLATIDGDESIAALDAKINMHLTDQSGDAASRWVMKWLLQKGFVQHITVINVDTGYTLLRRYSSAVS